MSTNQITSAALVLQRWYFERTGAVLPEAVLARAIPAFLAGRPICFTAKAPKKIHLVASSS